MDYAIFWVLFIAWAGTCCFYFFKIYRIARSLRIPIFSAVKKYNHAIRPLIKNLYTRIFVITIVFLVSLLLIYFVRFSSVAVN